VDAEVDRQADARDPGHEAGVKAGDLGKESEAHVPDQDRVGRHLLFVSGR